MPKYFHIKAEICDFSITGLPCIHRKYHFERMSVTENNGQKHPYWRRRGNLIMRDVGA